MKALTEQELHNLAMNVTGKELEKKGFEFLSVNSKLKKDPQFVCIKGKKLYFVIVKAITYPKDPKKFDIIFMETIKTHALKFKAKILYAGVGIANASDYEKPIYKHEEFVINYQGIIEI
ncbi:Na(+)-translocating NADH-quinone reductase subunit F [Leptobacterium sp. I13]|uniref:Na(+)-translocating NADH-quinone reductase subunit F n=1 Tax=Leptobacterium meishanense TaxID=3128904 RepID=UPI0030EBC475